MQKFIVLAWYVLGVYFAVAQNPAAAIGCFIMARLESK